MPNYFLLNKYNKSLQGFHFELFGDTKVSAKYWTAAPELWQKPLSTCFSYSMCSYKTVKVHRLHWSGALGMEKKSSWMSVSSLLKLIWHLLNKCSISLFCLELFYVRKGQQADVSQLKPTHFSRLVMHIRTSMLQGWGKMDFSEKKPTHGPIKESPQSEVILQHVMFKMFGWRNVLVCVCSSNHIEVTAYWDFLS